MAPQSCPVPVRPFPAAPWPRGGRGAALALVVVLVVVLSGCADDDPAATNGPTPTAQPAPTTDITPSDAAGGAAPPVDGEVSGTLGGSDVEGGCIWLDTPEGRYELVTAPNAAVAIDPGNRVVVDAQDGTVIAEEGQQVTVVGRTDDGLVTFCQVGTILAVEDVRTG